MCLFTADQGKDEIPSYYVDGQLEVQDDGNDEGYYVKPNQLSDLNYLKILLFSGESQEVVKDLQRQIDSLQEDNEELRSEVDAVRQSLAKFLDKVNPVYDTVDEEGNIVEADEEDEAKVAFAAASGALHTSAGMK